MRTQLEKYNNLDEEWQQLVEQVTAEFQVFKDKHAKMKSHLPTGKNLAELQGMSRREKDSNQIFEEKITEFNESMQDLGDVQPKTFVKQNADMLKSCPLFKDGGNYSEDEVEWYRAQMSEIDQLFSTMIENRAQHISDINAQADKLKKDPTAEFNLSYNDSIK